jgi:hypothetical protein
VISKFKEKFNKKINYYRGISFNLVIKARNRKIQKFIKEDGQKKNILNLWKL